MFVLTVTDAEMTSVRLVTPSLDVALHHRDLIVDSEYDGGGDFTAIDGDPLRLNLSIAGLGGDEIVVRVEIHCGVEVA